MNSEESVFNQFTRKYALSKTLRFELKPIGKTRENIEKTNPDLVHDRGIEESYQTLKPVLDRLHEEFITAALESETVKDIDFGEYLKIYTNLRGEKDKDKKEPLSKKLAAEESKLRKEFAKTYNAEGEKLKKAAGKNEAGKDTLNGKSYQVLTEANILKYIRARIDDFAALKLETKDGISVTKEGLEKALVGNGLQPAVFDKFFTYFSGFNQNRENYYSTEEKATAVANRIVSENLPRFCDNLLAFKSRADEYSKALGFLKEGGVAAVDKAGNELPEVTADYFDIKYFNRYLSQTGIEDYNKRVGEANLISNLYNQQRSGEQGFHKLPKFKELYKQIGCGEKSAFLYTIDDDKELLEALRTVINNGESFFVKSENLYKSLQALDSYAGIYWTDKAINTISSKYFANWSAIKEALLASKVLKKSKDDIKVPQAVELSDLFGAIDDSAVEVRFKETFKENDERKQAIKGSDQLNSQKLLGMIFADLSANRQLFNSVKERVLAITNPREDKNPQEIKALLDSLLFSNQILKYFKVRENKTKGAAPNPEIYDSLDKILYENNPVDDYDAIRNYLTKKPTSDINKLKLNFGNAVLAGGWDANKEPERWCIILKDGENNKYLAILTKDTKKLFERTKENKIYNSDGLGWQKMDYKLVPGPNKMLPKVFLASQRWRDKHTIPANIERIYDDESFKKGSGFRLKDMHALVDYFKDCIAKHEWGSTFNFNFSNTEEYEGIDQFYLEVERQGYKLSFTDIDKRVLDEQVEAGGVYLFQIRNRDNQAGKKGNSNLHTIYWDAVFSNEQNKPKLNGEAEIFYRPAISPEKLGKKKDGNKKEVIDHKRFAEEKFVFHCPITLNPCFRSSGLNTELNKAASEKGKAVHLLGIDRGEKHLAYYSLINQAGEIVEQGSLNKIGDGKNEHDYGAKLSDRAGERDEARKSWKTIGTIKELKDGYISQVVRKIVDLAIKNNAYIVLEDLNVGFKRGRQKIEKSVYQKLELALAKKLNFLVNKEAGPGEVGSVQNALQLTPLVGNFGDIKGKQFGIMLYTRANYTSQTDPVTGWRKTIYLKRGSEEKLKAQILDSFEDFGFDGKDYYFSYTNKDTGRRWTLYSGKDGNALDRFYGNRIGDGWHIERQDISGLLDDLFGSFDKKHSFKSQITKDGTQLTKVGETTAWESLRFAIDLMQQIRNTGNEAKDDDFLQSPVRDNDGNHFDSRISASIPNGDANGAYNIAQKGLIMFQRIQGSDKPDLYIKDTDWDRWLADKHR